jgi:hypothetical protein
LAVGFSGNAGVDTGMHKMVNTLINTGEDLVSKAQNIGNELESLNYTRDAGQSVNDVVSSANGILSDAKTVRTTINEINSVRSGVIIASLVFPLLLVGLGAVSGIFNLKYIAFLYVSENL